MAKFIFIPLFFLCYLLPTLSTSSTFLPINLLTEYRNNPYGIDILVPRFSWSLSLPDPSLGFAYRYYQQLWYQIQVFQGITSSNLIWDSTIIYSTQSSFIPYNNTHIPLLSDTTYSWWVRIGYQFLTNNDTYTSSYSNLANFHTALYNPSSDWQGNWIMGPNNQTMFRTMFTLPSNKILDHATLFGTGIGYIEMYLNNQRIGETNRKQDPGWTSYAHRIRYLSFDITSYINTSTTSVLGIYVGNGWFNCKGWYQQPPYLYPSATNGGGFCYNTGAMILIQMNLYFTDNTTMHIVSDTTSGNWYSAFSPIIFDSIYDGEWYNSTMDQYFIDWLMPTYVINSSLWSPVISATGPATTALLSAQRMEPVKVIESRSPINYWSYNDNTMVFDFGRNSAGVLRVQFPPGLAGQTVTLQHAEALTHPPYGPADGSIYTDGLRNAHATDVYIMNGNPNGETYEPRFTWHGFRYAAITNAPGPLTPDQVTYQVQHNDVRLNGEITFSSIVLEAIQAAVTTSISSNLQYGPGSCTNRDERQFFTGDTGLGAEVSIMNYQLGELYSDWLDTVVDEQNTDGSVGYYAPTPITDSRDGSANWITGFPTATYLLWWHYGDTKIIQDKFLALQRYMVFLQGKYNLTAPGLSNYWDEGPTEWVNLGPSGNNHLINAFALIHDVMMMINMSTAINEIEYSQQLNNWLTILQTEYYEAFYNTSTGYYGYGTQTEQVLSLYIQAYPNLTIANTVINYLVQDIMVNQNGHILTGIIGTRFIFEVLSRFGYSSVAFQVLQNISYPGYGWMVMGIDNPEPATSIWEEWDTDTEGAIMASRNHLMFSSVGVWFYQRLGGIMPLSAGYETLSIAPQYVTDEQLSFMSTSLNTLYGWIRVSWWVGNKTVPNSPILCGEKEEADAPNINYVNLNCGKLNNITSIITNVTFASFGEPQGSCTDNSFTVGTCNAPSSMSVVEKYCLNQTNCSIPVSVSTFGVDPCEGTKKSLAVIVSCNNQSNIPTTLPIMEMNVTIPYGIQTTYIAFPIIYNISTMVIMESNIIIWNNEQFISNSVPGIINGSIQHNPIPAVVLEVGSGVYTFISEWMN